MMRFRSLAPLFACLLIGGGVLVPGPGHPAIAAGNGLHWQRSCARTQPGFVHCQVYTLTTSQNVPFTNSTYYGGYGAPQIHGGYNLPCAPGGAAQVTCGAHNFTSSDPIIGIVDAYNQPHLNSDLQVYDGTAYSSTPPSWPALTPCSTSNGCLTIMGQTGSTSKLAPNDSFWDLTGWGLEETLDVEMAHAVCQTCKILLVEANSAKTSNLLAAIDTAVSKGAKVVSMSWGGAETSSDTTYNSHFQKLGKVFVAGAGDSGYHNQQNPGNEDNWPASSPWVTSVGGTVMNLSPSNYNATSYTYLNESVWNSSGGGCSVRGEPAQPWQTSIFDWSSGGCGSSRADSDVSAYASDTAIYDTTSVVGQTGWFDESGTSVATPIIAATYALANPSGISSSKYGVEVPYENTATTNGGGATVYGDPMSAAYMMSSFHDVASGSNSSSNCSPTDLCTAGSGWDGPSGIGTPNGVGGFLSP